MVSSPLDRYFEAVDAGDAAAATAAFAEDALYVRPSLEVPGALEVVRGQKQLVEFFQRRGKLPFRHVVRACAADGPGCFVEGAAVADGRETHVFLARATFDGDGLITRYFALMAEAPSA